jgi:hypothetical protein
MGLRCEWCGGPAVLAPGEPLYCARCRERDAEWHRNWEEVRRSGGDWSPSRHDPWWRDWLTSRELFDWYHDSFPRLGERIHSILDGEVFEYNGDGHHPVQAWISTSEVVVAYAPSEERYGAGPRGGLEEFAGWIDHLRHSEPLLLGRVRGRSSYGAIRTDCPTTAPVVKWAQAGDWAALAQRSRPRGRPA